MRTNGQTRRLRRVAAIIAVALTGTAGLAAPAAAQQANWTKTSELTCQSQTGYFSFNRSSGGLCRTNRAATRDSNLRTSGLDTFQDGFFVGSLPGTSPNTHSVNNQWSITARICADVNFSGQRNTISSGQSQGISGVQGLLSFRGSACS